MRERRPAQSARRGAVGGFAADILLGTLLERSRLPQSLDVATLRALHEAYRDQSDFQLHKVWELSLGTSAEALPEEGEVDFRAAFDEILRYWVGGQGLRPAQAADIACLAQFLNDAGVKGGVWRRVLQSLESEPAKARRFEIFSLAELAVLSRHLSRSPGRLAVIEIGGGFGRLGHVFLSLERPVTYVNIDLVPQSLVMSAQFLAANHLETPVSLALAAHEVDDFFAGPAAEKSALVLPPWHLSRIPLRQFDLAINIASFQEMHEPDIQRYLSFFDAAVRPGGIVLIHNSRDYPYPKEFVFPANWAILHKDFSLRSFGGDYPLEIFRAMDAARPRSANRTLVNRYNANLVARYRADNASLTCRLRQHIDAARRLRQRIEELNHRLGGSSGPAAGPAPPVTPPATTAAASALRTEPVAQVRLRPFPWPFKAMLAICSDIDLTTPARFAVLHRFLNTREKTPLGEGLGLDVADSFWFYAPAWRGYDPPDRQMAYYAGLDWRERSPFARQVLNCVRGGWIDTLHTYGNFSVQDDGKPDFTREHAERALAVLEEAGLAVSVWANHGDRNNIQNIGRNDYMAGDLPDHPCRHSDLMVAAGIKFLWSSEISPEFRRDAVVGPVVLRDGQTVWRFQRHDFAFRDDAADLAKELGAITRSREGRPIVMVWHPKLLHIQLSPENLAELAAKGGYAILGQHLGLPSQAEILPATAADALRRLKTAQDCGDILVARTSRLLQYAAARDHLRFAAAIDVAGKTVIDITGIDDPVSGWRPPAVEELRGITFEVGGEGPVELHLLGRAVRRDETVEYSSPETRIIGIRWFAADCTDYFDERG